MKIAIPLITMMLIVVSGCKSNDELAGTGPLVLSPEIKAFIDRMDGHDAAIAVSYQGEYAYAWGCPLKGAGQCASLGIDAASTVGACEERASRCGLYRYGDFILWKGPVTVSGDSQQQVVSKRSNRGLSDLSKAQLCRISSNVRAGVAHWEPKDSVQRYVIEAKLRGLTPNECATILGLKLSNPINLPINKKDISDRLAKLKGLLEKGLITPKEAEEKRKEILNSL